jgi:glutamine amidotransferase
MTVALIDYGAGNLTSVRKALSHVGLNVFSPRSPVQLEGCRAIVVPGVGHFDATTPLDGGFRTAMLEHVRRGRPLLGICLGLQWLFEGSDEAPGTPGLGVLGGRCFRLSGPVKVPHVGWNTLESTRPSSILEGLEGASVYFTHSYAAPVTDATAAVTSHGVPFASVVEAGCVIGVQWHPEKSGEAGLTLLRNFARLVLPC